jgi:hypothetical protein
VVSPFTSTAEQTTSSAPRWPTLARVDLHDDRHTTSTDTTREVALDGGFNVGPTSTALADLQPKTVFIAGRQQPGSKRTQRRMRRYRTGAEGRISHLKRRYGLDRSRLKGDEGEQI